MSNTTSTQAATTQGTTDSRPPVTRHPFMAGTSSTGMVHMANKRGDAHCSTDGNIRVTTLRNIVGYEAGETPVGRKLCKKCFPMQAAPVPTITEIRADEAAVVAKKVAAKKAPKKAAAPVVEAAPAKKARKPRTAKPAAVEAAPATYEADSPIMRAAFKSGTTFRNVEAKFKGDLDVAVAVYKRQAEYNGKTRSGHQVLAFIEGWKALDK